MVEFKQTAEGLQCVFRGRLDTPACQELEAEVLEKVEGAMGAVVFDMKEVEYISSMFFRLCIQANKLVDTGMFSVEHAQPEIKSMFKIAGLSQMLNVQ